MGSATSIVRKCSCCVATGMGGWQGPWGYALIHVVELRHVSPHQGVHEEYVQIRGTIWVMESYVTSLFFVGDGGPVGVVTSR